MKQRGQRGNTKKADTDVVIFNVRGSVKRYLRVLLAERSGLDPTTIYPTPWESPFLEQFAEGYGRGRGLGGELSPEGASVGTDEEEATN